MSKIKNTDWWGDWSVYFGIFFKIVHTHSINGNHYIGETSRDRCQECIKRWGIK